MKSRRLIATGGFGRRVADRVRGSDPHWRSSRIVGTDPSVRGDGFGR
jgi:hypothetical protein